MIATMTPNTVQIAAVDDAYRIEFDAASAAIAGDAPPTFGRSDAVDQATAIEAVRQSARLGVPVELAAATGSRTADPARGLAEPPSSGPTRHQP